MEKKVKISFSALQRSDNEKAEISQILDGTRVDQDGAVYLSFEESWEGVEGLVHSDMRVTKERIVVERSGPVQTRMDFLPDEDTMCEYRTQIGTIAFVISTLTMDVGIGEERLSFFVRYEMYAQGELVSENELSVEARDA